MVTTITEVLNIWNDLGVFSYVIPFLLIFAVVFAILKKTKILGKDNDGILAIIATALGLLSLQFDYVSEFFAVIFPRFGIGISIFLVLIILLGFFIPKDEGADKMGWVGWVTGLGVVIWALSAWDEWNNFGGFGGWFADNIWAILILGGIIGLIAWTIKSGKESG
jgi:hypothetical protein